MQDGNMKIISDARRTVGLQGISQEAVENQIRLGAESEAEAMLSVVKEFVVKEMKVVEEVFDEMEIEKVFAPAKDKWNILYIKFAYEGSVHKLYSYTRNLKADLRLIPYIPTQFYQR